MKKIFLGFVALIICASSCNNKQTGQNEVNELRLRFSGFVHAIAGMNMDSIQDYTYPKLFTILSRSQSRESMERSFAFLKGRAEIDSVLIDTLYPVSHIDKGSYSIAICSMVIRMPLDSTENITNKPLMDPTRNKTLLDSSSNKHLIDGRYPAPSSTLMTTLIKSNEYGMEVTGYNEINGISTIRMRVATIAAKDEYAKDWTFLGVTSDQELINKLFSKKVLEKLASYNMNK